MSIHSSRSNNSSIISNNTKIQALDSVLQQSFHYLKGQYTVILAKKKTFTCQY